MKQKFRSLCAIVFIVCASISIQAQQKTITGIVSDDSGPLPGVSVIIKSTATGTETDFEGKYSINANTGDVLVFSFVGMTIEERIVGDSNTINVQMKSGNLLDEVVVTALGLERKKDDDVSSTTTVNTDALNRSGESGLIQGLAGKTSGLKITRNTGDPGAGAYIQIRGQNTINGNSSPLIILDGTPISNTSVTFIGGQPVGGSTGGVSQQSRLNDISAEDIESVTVLKGAAAAAVWGTGAANGVIVVKTKKGRSGGKKTSINIKSSIITDKINVEFEKQNKFGQGIPLWWTGTGNDYSANSGIWVPNTGFSWGDRISARSGQADEVTVGNTRFESINGNIIYPIVNKNDDRVFNDSNRDLVFGDGFTFDNSVSLSFAGDDSNTFISFNQWDQKGIIKGRSNYKRQTLRLNQTSQLSDKITAKFNASYSKVKSDRIQQGSNLAGLYLGYLRTSPDFDNSDYIGTYYNDANVPTQNSHRSYRNYIGNATPTYNNPLWTANQQDNPNAVERIILTPQLTWKVKDNMILTARYGIDSYTDHRETFFPVFSAGSPNGFYQEQEIKERTENLNVFMQSSHEISNNLNLSWILGTTLDRTKLSWLSADSQQFTNPDVGDLRIFGNATADNEFPDNFRQETRKSGAYAVVNFDLYNQLFIEFTGRYERPSTLEKNIFYPSASLGWKFTDLIKENNVLSFGKLRASYGEIGIEPAPYSSSTIFRPGGIVSTWGDGLAAAAYGNPFTRDVTLGNPNLKEERVKEFEIGTDLRLFNNSVTLGVTYYDRVTEDALLNIDVPASTGFAGVLDNAAEITNKGLEVDLGINLLTQGDFKWSLNANYSHNDNLVTDLSGVQSVFLAGFQGTSSRVVEGHPIGTLWGGKFQRDASNNYVLDSNGFPVLDGAEGVIGDPNPDWIGGIGTVISFKGLSLSAQFETSQGNEHWKGTEGVLKFFGIHPETAIETTAATDLQTYDGRTITAGTTFRGVIGDFGGGPVALDSEWYRTEGGGFGNQSETFVQDASWTRLREVSLSYQLPKKYIDRLGFDNVSFTLTGRNLILWTDIEGFDPDINLTGATLGRGLDYFTNPASKSYAFTLKMGF